MTIRQETPADFDATCALVKAAFETAEHTDGNEHNLVGKLRKSAAFIPELSLLAEEDGALLGHILLTRAKVGSCEVLALAPLSVAPAAQKRGVGTALMRQAHARAAALGFDIVVVLGSEHYYPRVGYRPASQLGIRAPFDVPDANFMALSLSGSTATLNGTLEYAKEMLEA